MNRKKILLSFFVVLCTLQLKAQQNPTDTTLSDAQKLYGLSLFWQEANYNYAYFSNVPDLNWDSAYRAFIPEVLATRSMYEYYRVLEKFCALLKDGHTNVYLPNFLQSKILSRSFGEYIIEVKYIEQKPIIVNIAAGTEKTIPIGSEILAVNDLPVKDYVEKFILPYISQSADYKRLEDAYSFLLKGLEGETIKIRFKKPDNVIADLTLRREANKDVKWLNAYPPLPLLKLTWLPNQIAKLDLNSFGDKKIIDSFLQVLPQLYQAKAVIIDLRENRGGDSEIASEILSYFTNQSTLLGSKWATREHRASFKAWGKFSSNDPTDTSSATKLERDYFAGKVWYEGEQMKHVNQSPVNKRLPNVPMAVLFGHRTGSAAEDFLIMLDGLPKRATTFGEKSAATTGQPLFFSLPGGGSARICTKKDTYPDGRIFVGKGIQPDYEIIPTLNDFLKKLDPVLEKAVQFLQK